MNHKTIAKGVILKKTSRNGQKRVIEGTKEPPFQKSGAGYILESKK
jgi:hypothetical protein